SSIPAQYANRHRATFDPVDCCWISTADAFSTKLAVLSFVVTVTGTPFFTIAAERYTSKLSSVGVMNSVGRDCWANVGQEHNNVQASRSFLNRVPPKLLVSAGPVARVPSYELKMQRRADLSSHMIECPHGHAN